MVGRFHGMLLLSAKHSRSLVWLENTSWTAVRTTILKAWLFRLEQWWNVTLFLLKTCRDCTSSARMSYQEYSSDMSYMRGDLERRHLDRKHWRIGPDGRIRNPRQKAHCKGSIDANERWSFHIPNRRWNCQTLWRRPVSENIHLNLGSPRPRRRTRKPSRKIRRIIFNPTSRRLNPFRDSSWYAGEAINDLWYMSGNFIFRYHVEPRVRLYSPREESFTIPLEIHRRDQGFEYIVGCNAGSTGIGTLIEIENWQIRGHVSQDSLYGMKNHRRDVHCPRRDWQENKRPLDQALCGQRFGRICPMRRSVKRSKSDPSRKQNSTVPENCVVFTSLILMMENSKISRRMHWKFRCQPQCLAKFNMRSTGKPVALKMKARQNTLALLRPVNLRGSAWKELFADIMKIIMQEKEWVHWITTILCANLFLCLKQWKYQMQKQQWRKAEDSSKYRHGSWRRSETKKRWSMKAEKLVHFASLMDLCHLKNSELEQKLQKYKDRVVLRGDIVKDDSGSYAVFEAGIISIFKDGCRSNGYYRSTRSSRRSIRLHACQNGRCTDVIEQFQSQNVQRFGYVYRSTNDPNHGPVWQTQSFLLKGICTVIFWQDY